MKHEIDYVLTRGDEEFELVIEYDINPYDAGCVSGPPEHCYPPEGGDVTDLRATLDGNVFELLAIEEREIIEQIEATHDHYDDGAYYDDCEREAYP